MMTQAEEEKPRKEQQKSRDHMTRRSFERWLAHLLLFLLLFLGNFRRRHTSSCLAMSVEGARAMQEGRRVAVGDGGVLSSSSSSTTTTTTTVAGVVKNFRPALGVPCLYRCASTDVLANVKGGEDTDPQAEFFRRSVGLVLDLRSASERDESKAMEWMSREGFTVVEKSSNNDDNNGWPSYNENPIVLRLDVLSPTAFMKHLEDCWLTPQQKFVASMYKISDIDKLHELRMDVLNEKGLVGLNEGILETGGRHLCQALCQITLFLEQQQRDQQQQEPSSNQTKKKKKNVVVHCVQGKDRYVSDKRELAM